MFLKSIHLKNVKCFDELSLSFEEEAQAGTIRQWTLLLGENGTGKSTLLKAIALVTSGSEALSDLLTEPSDWIQYGEKECVISAVLLTKEMEEKKITLSIQQEHSRLDAIIHNKESLQWLDEALKQSPEDYFLVGFGAYRHLSSNDSFVGKRSAFLNVRAQSVATLFDPDATLNPLESWAMSLDYQHDTGLDIVRDVLDDFLPGISFSQIDKQRGRLLFKTEDGIVPLRSLGDGYQSVAAWIGDLLYRVMQTFDNHPSPLEARGLLLIDEVDLHFHPKWQQELFSFLSSRLPNFQLIITTHSPMIAQQVGPGELHYIRRENGRINLEQFTGNPRSLLLNQMLMSEAFGVESDESWQLQEKKARYRKLRDQEQLSAQEKEELDQLATELSERPRPEGTQADQICDFRKKKWTSYDKSNKNCRSENRETSNQDSLASYNT